MTSSQHGKPPCPFSWFVLGSAGRFEQGPVSDQDHGMIYETDDGEARGYFLRLGMEISHGLNEVGYPYCDGFVMSSNPLWCRSLKQWSQQINEWIVKETLDSIRYIQILFDARVLIGEYDYIGLLKQQILIHCEANPKLLHRFFDNIKHVKKSVGIFGQLLVQPHGPYEGHINLKYSAFLPYVNTTRILAIKEGITDSSTLFRLTKLESLHSYDQFLKPYKDNFKTLLHFRMSSIRAGTSYEESHYLFVKNLSTTEKKVIKQILKDGEKFHSYVQKLIEKGC